MTTVRWCVALGLLGLFVWFGVRLHQNEARYDQWIATVFHQGA